MTARAPRGVLLACALLAVACPIFRKKHIRVDAVPQLPYPRCGDRPLPPGELIASRSMRSGPVMVEQNVVERFELHRRDCAYTATVRQVWPLTVADVEVVYDADLLPLRAWKRQSIPGDRRPGIVPDLRRYELRTPEVTITHRAQNGTRTYEILRGPHPRVVIGPGRGLITVWLRRAQLAVGGRLREQALDIREEVEQIREVTLRREPDQYEASLGRTVRVYTFYGREAVFADENDVVLGDLAGLRPSESLRTPMPSAMDGPGEPPDPVNTP